MVTMREELTSLGHLISSDDFAAMILSSVPMSYEPTLSAMTASAKVSRQDQKSLCQLSSTAMTSARPSYPRNL